MDETRQTTRRSVLRATGAAVGAGLAAGVASGQECGPVAGSRSFEGQVGPGSAAERRYELNSDDACRVRLQISADNTFGAAVAMYATKDGRQPTSEDHDAGEYSYWGTDEVVFEDLSAQSEIRVRVESLYGSTAFDLTVEEFGPQQYPNCGRSVEWSTQGSVAEGESVGYLYRFRTESPCTTTIELSGEQGTDMDLYVTYDGRRPATDDYDRRSFGTGSGERIELEDHEVTPGGEIGILVDSYSVGGSFGLTVTEEGSGELIGGGGGGGCTAVAERDLRLSLADDDELATVFNTRSPDPCRVDLFVESVPDETGQAPAVALEAKTGGGVPSLVDHDYRKTVEGDGRAQVTFDAEELQFGSDVGIHAYADEVDPSGELRVLVREYGSGQVEQDEQFSDAWSCDSLVRSRRVTVDAAEVPDLATTYAPESDYPCKVVVGVEAEAVDRPVTLWTRSDGQIPDTEEEAERSAETGRDGVCRTVYGVVASDAVLGAAPQIDAGAGEVTLIFEEWA